MGWTTLFQQILSKFRSDIGTSVLLWFLGKYLNIMAELQVLLFEIENKTNKTLSTLPIYHPLP